jgi:tetratricopeptide (TPR) repeat protein
MAAQLADKSYIIKDAMKALSDGLQNIYYMGSALYQAGDYKGAYEAFQATYHGYALLKKHNEPTTFDPAEHPVVLEYSGVCAQQAGLIDEAKAVYRQMIAEGHADAGTYEALIGLERENNPAEAERLLLEARQKFPDDTALLYAEINLYLGKGELTGLISKLERALELEPNNTSVLVTLGQVYDKLYQDSVAINPTAAESHFNKAMLYYQQAVAKEADNFDAIYSIGALWPSKQLPIRSNSITCPVTTRLPAIKI